MSMIGSKTAIDQGSASKSFHELETAARALREGVEIKDRTYRGKSYPNTFLASDAARWAEGYLESEDEVAAVDLLNQLRRAGLIQHAVDPHKPFKVGQTKKLYFCFVHDNDSAVQQNPSRQTQQFNRQKSLTKRALQEVFHHSEEFLALERKWHRMEASMQQLTETQVVVQTKLLIVQECTMSLVQGIFWTAMLLLVLLSFTVFEIVPSLHSQENEGGMIATGILLLVAVVFLTQGRRLMSVWNALEEILVQPSEQDDESVGFEDDAPLAKKQRGLRRRSSLFLKDSFFIEESQSSVSMTTNSLKELQHRSSTEIPDPTDWPHRPVLVCVNTPVSESLEVQQPYGDGPCPIGKPFSFSSGLFEGQCLIRLKGIDSDAVSGDDAYFEGRRRLFQTIIQGRFKEPLNVRDVLTGHEFSRPLLNLPHPWILNAATNLIGKLAPGAKIQVSGDNPTMLAPLAATSQIVRGDEPGNEPDIASDEEVMEDCSMLGGKFESGNVSASGRKLHLASPARAGRYTFDTETVFTFDFYQSLLDCKTYALNLGVANIRMAPILNGQPIQCLCKTSDGRYLWSFQVWHESLLPRGKTKQA